MADLTFTTVESAIVSKLESAITYAEDRNIASYAGQIEDADAGLPVEAPACFVMFDGAETVVDDTDARQHVVDTRWSVLVVGDSYKGGTESRTNTTNGAYKLIDDVIAALDDDSLSQTGFAGLTFIGIEPVKVTSVRAMYRVRFSARLVITR